MMKQAICRVRLPKHSIRRRITLSPQLAPFVEEVSFPSYDGVTLRGWFLPSPAAADCLIVCHGYRSSRADTLGIGLELQKLGHNVLLFDFRAHGQSDGRRATLGLEEAGDLAGALEFLRERRSVDPERIGGLGFSMGASALLLAAAHREAIKAIVADSAYAHLEGVIDATLRSRLPYPLKRLRPMLSAAARWITGLPSTPILPLDYVECVAPRPVLFIHGLADDVVPAEHSRLLHAASGEPKDIWLVPGAGHVQSHHVDPYLYVGRVHRFFEIYLQANDRGVGPETLDRVEPSAP